MVEKTIIRHFINKVREHPDKLFVLHENQELTYKEISLKVLHLKEHLNRKYKDVKKVGLHLSNSIELYISVLAVRYIGAIVVLIDPQCKPNEIQQLIHKSHITQLITKKENLVKFKNSTTKLAVSILDLENPEIWTGSNLDTLKDEIVNEASKSEALYQFTSGTTGWPKCVVKTEDQLFNEALNIIKSFKLNSNNVVMALAPIYHSYGFDFCFLAVLYAGATSVICTEINPRKIVKLLNEQRVDIVVGTPGNYKMLVNTNTSVNPENRNMNIISAGSKLEDSLRNQFIKKHGIQIINHFGSTETGALTYDLKGSNSCGYPMFGVEIKIVDKAGKEVGENKRGNVWVKSKAIASRYLDERIQVYKGWYETGDIGYFDEHHRLVLLGRKDGVLKCCGKKIDPTEIKKVVAGYEGVGDVKVMGMDSKLTGEIVKVIVYTQIKITENELRRYCAERLSDFKVPRIFEIHKIGQGK